MNFLNPIMSMVEDSALVALIGFISGIKIKLLVLLDGFFYRLRIVDEIIHMRLLLVML